MRILSPDVGFDCRITQQERVNRLLRGGRLFRGVLAAEQLRKAVAVETELLL